MAGAGRTDLIDAVIDRFANYAPSSNFETREIIRAEIITLGLAEEDSALARTCWLAAYLTHGAAGPQAQLALASRDDNYEFGHFPHNRVAILAPAGMALDVSRQFNTDAQTKFDVEVRDAPSEQRLQRCASIVGEVVKAMAKLNDSVGPRFSIGYLDTSNTPRVSNVVENVDALKWN